MSLGPLGLLDSYSIPRQTQTADTAIVATVPPRGGKRTKLFFIQYTSAGTQHTITIMRELGRAKLTAAAAAAATTFILDQDPGKYSTSREFGGLTGAPVSGVAGPRQVTPSAADNNIAASDYIVVQMADGTFWTTTVSSCTTNADGTVTVTVSAIPGAGINKGATVWFMGVAADTDPHFNAANPVLKPTTSATTPYPAAAAGGGSVVAQSFHMNSPIIVYSDNPTAAGVLDYGTAGYGV